jgi:hypothetical protein
MRSRTIAALLVLCMALTLAAPATSFGQEGTSGSGSAARAEYFDDSSVVLSQQEGDDDGDLPFTGHPVVPVLLAGLGLLGAGLVLHRRTRPSDER